MDRENIASIAVMNSDARALAAETAAAQIVEGAQNFAARAAQEVFLTRDQARQACEFADRASTELQQSALGPSEPRPTSHLPERVG